MSALVIAGAADRVADHPAHRIAGRHRRERLARLQRNIGDALGRRIELVEGAFREWIDLDRVDIAVFRWFLGRSFVGIGDAFRRLTLILGHLSRFGLQLTRQRKRFCDLDDLHRLVRRLLDGGWLEVRLVIGNLGRRHGLRCASRKDKRRGGCDQRSTDR
jgi:hypothetical protein